MGEGALEGPELKMLVLFYCFISRQNQSDERLYSVLLKKKKVVEAV